MNKTISINLGGWFFHVEEDGYRQLDNYLRAIQGYFSAEPGCTEIVEDIESRIAEMFQDVLTQQKRQVVISADVHRVMQIMGKPEQFDNDLPESDSTLVQRHLNPQHEQPQLPVLAATPANNLPVKESNTAARRFYRNPDDKFISGVCSGLAAYIGIEDPTWVRLLFAGAFFLSGSTIVIPYLVIMVIVPEAQTSAQKLAMKGEPVNLSNIEKTVKEGVDNLRVSIENFSQSEKGERTRRFFNHIGEKLETGIPAAFRSLNPVVSIAIVAIAVALLLGFAGMLLGWVVSMFNAVPFLSSFLFGSSAPAISLALSGMVALGVPLVFLSYFILRRTLHINSEGFRQWGGALGLLWILSIASMSFTGARAYTNGFDTTNYAELTIPIPAPDGTDVLRLDVIDDRTLENIRENNESNMPFSLDNDAFDFSTQTYYSDNIELNIERSQSEQIELYRKTTAKGGDYEEAIENAKTVKYQINQKEATLLLSPYFTAEESKWRQQNVQLTLKLPVGKAVFLTEGIRPLIYDIKNVTNTYDGDMIGHTWIMTERGLALANAQLKPIYNEDEVRKIVKDEDLDLQQTEAVTTPETGNSEAAKELDYKGFDELDIGGALKVNVAQSEQYYIRIDGNSEALAQLDIKLNNDKLMVRQGSIGDVSDITIEIGMPDLQMLEVGGACVVSATGFVGDKLKLKISDAAELNAEFTTTDLQLELESSAQATLNGEAKQIKAILSGASELDAHSLHATSADMTLSGKSRAEIYASDQLDSQLSEAAYLSYKGNTTQVNNKISDTAKAEAE